MIEVSIAILVLACVLIGVQSIVAAGFLRCVWTATNRRAMIAWMTAKPVRTPNVTMAHVVIVRPSMGSGASSVLGRHDALEQSLQGTRSR
ncbi:MAG: hypothetical protein ABFE01_01075 [Phycisphaerales bacterium]|jgi:hypothetical protein